MHSHKKTRVAFYLRVSTKEQAEAFGIEMQRKSLHALLDFKQKSHDWLHKREWLYIDEGKSGADLKRPSFKAMMEGAKNGGLDKIRYH